MTDNESKLKSRMQHVKEVQQERAADFWQRTIADGRIQRRAGARMTEGQQAAQKPRQPRQS